MSSASIPRAGLVLLGLLFLGRGFNWPIVKVVITEIPRWQDFAALALVLTAIGTVLVPAPPLA